MDASCSSTHEGKRLASKQASNYAFEVTGEIEVCN